MPLAQPLADLRHQLEAQVRDNQLPEALNALLALLPDGSESYRIVSALVARLNAANKERYRNTLSFEEYQRLVAQVSADFLDLLSGLKENDFEAVSDPAPNSNSGKKARVGNVLYRVPGTMPLQKPTRCTVRVAMDEDAILSNMVLDEHVEVRSQVEVSDVMSAELVDPEGGVFQIRALNGRTQLVRETGYTEWNFGVTPLVEGVHQLLVKVSIMEIVPGFAEPIPRDVTVMETVTIVTESLEPAPAAPGSATVQASVAAFKSSGQSFAFQNNAGGIETQGAYNKGAGTPAPENPAPKSSNRGLRGLALFLGFLVLAPAATWAFAPDLPAWVNARYIQDTPEAYAEFIRDYPESPRRENAFFYKAEATDSLADLRRYQQNFRDGKFADRVSAKIDQHEMRAVARIREQPDSFKIQRFVNDFPETERLAEVKQAVETRANDRPELMTAVENAYVRSVKTKPTEAKVVAYLRDFPKQSRLNEVETAARARPEVFEKVRPELEEAYLRKMEENPTVKQAEQFLDKFPEPVQREKFDKIVSKKPAVKQASKEKMQKIEDRKRLRRDGGGF